MKLKEKFLILIVSLLTVLLVSACVQASTDNLLNVPSVTISNPKSNDTIYAGKFPLNYTASDYYSGPGLTNIEVIINGNYDKAIQYIIKAGDNALPKIYLEFDQGKIGSRITSLKLIAYNKESKSAASNEVLNLYVGENKNPPADPDSLKIERFSRSEIFLTWKDNSVNETKFEVWRKDGPDGTSRVLNEITAESKSFTDQFLSPFVIYYYKVRAVNKYGASLFTNEVNSSEAAGNEPFDLTAEAVGASSVVLRWKNMLYVAETIRVERKHATASLWDPELIRLSPTTEEYIDRQGVRAGTTYKYRVGALILGKWIYSNEVMVQTFMIDVNPPLNLKAEFISSTNSVKLDWGSYPPNATGTKIERRRSDSQGFNEIAMVNKDTTTFIDASISEESVYYYRIRYTTFAGFNSFPSNEVSISISKFGPKAPSNLSIANFGNNIYLLQWQDNANNEDGYVVYYKQANTATYSVAQNLSADTRATTISPPTVGVNYHFAIKAVRGNLYSEFSNVVSTDGSGDFRLTWMLRKAANISTGVILTWTKPSGSILAFDIERKIGTGSWEKVKTLLSSEVTFIDVPPTFGDYTYRIKAVFPQVPLYSNEIIANYW